MIICAACGRQLQREDLGAGSFPCPSCKVYLRVETRPPRFVGLVGLAVAFLVPCLAGARGNDIIWYGALLCLPMLFLSKILRLLFFPKVVKDTCGDGFPHIIAPPDPPSGP